MSGSLERATSSAEQTEALGRAFSVHLEPGDVVALKGPLGAGKTRFVQGVARGWNPGQRVRSPSFTLINEYPGRTPLFHLDLYRLEPRDVDGLGLEECAEQGPLLVEWGERLPGAWLAEALLLAFEPVSESERLIRGSAFGGRGKELLEHWRQLEQP